jgi:hypothetical protein
LELETIETNKKLINEVDVLGREGLITILKSKFIMTDLSKKIINLKHN